MRLHDLQLDMVLRGIIMTRGEEGASIDEIRTDYYNIFLEPWPLKGRKTKQIIDYLLQIDGLMMEELENDLCIWYIDDIGSHISERDLDSNNNIVTSTETEDASMTSANLSGNSNGVSNNSYAIAPPCIPRIMVTSSFVNEDQAHGVSATTSDIFGSIGNELIKPGQKRHLSHGSESINTTSKRLKPVEANLPLIEMNLDIHNRKSGANGIAKQATSTEKESSILVQNGCNEVIHSNEYVAPILEPVPKQLSA